jgi:hypothetical protein
MVLLPKSQLWRAIIVFGGFAMLVAVFYAEENWRGERVWENCKREQESLDVFDLAHNTISPSKVDELSDEFDKFSNHKSPYKLLAVVAVPNFARPFQILAHNQTMANEAQIVCALERYHFAHGEYPETLDTLAPQFIEKIPHDIIGGQPLHYRRTDDGKFLLYSVGWNETDDGGQEISELNKYGKPDYTKGDWVWKN